MTLHEAIREVLLDVGVINAKGIAHAVNEKKLYSRKDGKPVNASQIIARIKSYPQIFKQTKYGIIELTEKQVRGQRNDYDVLFKDLLELSFSTSINIDEYIISISAILLYGEHSSLEFKLQTRNKPNAPNLPLLQDIISQNNSKKLFVSKLKEYFLYKNQANSITSSILQRFNSIEDSIFNRIINKIIEFDLGWLASIDFEKVYDQFLQQHFSHGHNERLITDENINLSIANQVAKIFNVDDKLIFDPACGSALTLISVSDKLTKVNGANRANLNYIGHDSNSLMIELATIYLLMNGVNNFETKLNNSISDKSSLKNSVDIVVSDLPLGVSEFDTTQDTQFNLFKSKRLELQFLQLIIELMNQKGRAVVNIPNTILYGTTNDQLKCRKYLIENDLIEAVISFDTRNNNHKSKLASSIIILNKNKALGSRNNITFELRPDKDSNKITIIYNNIKIAKNEIVINIKELKGPDFILMPNRYLIQAKVKSEIDEKDLIQLSSVIKEIKLSLGNYQDAFQLIKIKDLSESEMHYKLKHWTANSLPNETLKYYTLNQSALLVAKVGGRLKPTWFEYENIPIQVSSNIGIYLVDQNKINLEYLIFEFYKPYFLEQFETILVGSAQPYWISNEFQRLHIIIRPTNAQQKEVATTQARLRQIKLQQDPQILEDIASQMRAQYEINFANYNHLIKNKILQIRSDVQLINISSLELLDGRSQDESLINSILTTSRDLLSKINRLSTIVTNESATIEDLSGQLISESIEMIDFLKHVVSQCTSPNITIKIINNIPENLSNLSVLGNKNLLEKVFYELIDNAIKHGGRDKLVIAMEISTEKEDDQMFLQIIVMNDGKPFHETFTFKQYIQKNKAAGHSGGTGMGGYFINEAIMKHQGKLREYSNNNNLSKFPMCFEILLPLNSFSL